MAPLEAWPPPAPLEGVKSRRRALFALAEGSELAVEGGETLVASMSIALKLESRIAAVTVPGRALVGLLLGERQLTAGQSQRHQDLAVTHLGPHLAAEASAAVPRPCCGDHLAAVAAALQGRPQVVVLDEGRAAGDEAWAVVFRQLLESEALKAYRGAVVVQAAEEIALVKRACAERWVAVGQQLWQVEDSSTPGIEEEEEEQEEEMSSAGDTSEEIVEDALSATLPEELLDEVRALSGLCFNEEDSVAKSQKNGWSMMLLVATADRRPGLEGHALQQLIGFLCYQHLPAPKAEFHIRRVAVSEEHRGSGHGRQLVQWALDRAANLPQSQCAWVSLSAFNHAIPFYERLGFTDMTCGDPDDPDGQTWMERKNVSRVPDVPEADIADCA
uniref:N-acetyltransferase domain-containing protein n=1 Tax=Alexandrium monilatum TaxID=311494 RepID=A0A7S4R4J4_9DINO